MNEELKVDCLSLSFGGLQVLSQVSLSVASHSITAIIGPNGAGKTSLLNCITGLYRAQQGKVWLKDEVISQLKPHQIAAKGISRVFQNIELFRGMTVLENLLLGRHMHIRSGIVSSAIWWGHGRREDVAHRRRVEEIIDFLEIEHIRKQVVGSLPYGLQKRVELGRALAMEPRLLLLDEPVAGMNVEERQDMARFTMDTKKEWGITIALIEHDMRFVMDLADKVIVLDFGRKIAEGLPSQIQNDPQVIRAYLGTERSNAKGLDGQDEVIGNVR